jgi:2-polyprenyl-3-methyl-5-hydroxy-6-metoxy-1,4-benzoquinol methylase
MGWRDIADNPFSAAAKAHRDAVLQRAFIVEQRTREEVLVDLCRGQRVLDIGCVGTDVHPPWRLHRLLASVATEIIGVDFEPTGVKAMRDAGYDVIEANISRDISEISARGPFDVVIAGELIEHLDAPIDLFFVASKVLTSGGSLVITTPNPYLPVRGRRGARRETWESVDHVAYYPPTGIAELAERAGLTLMMATTVGGPPRSLRRFMQYLNRRLRGEQDDLSLLDVLIYRLRSRGGQLGDTAIFVVKK